MLESIFQGMKHSVNVEFSRVVTHQSYSKNLVMRTNFFKETTLVETLSQPSFLFIHVNRNGQVNLNLNMNYMRLLGDLSLHEVLCFRVKAWVCILDCPSNTKQNYLREGYILTSQLAFHGLYILRL